MGVFACLINGFEAALKNRNSVAISAAGFFDAGREVGGVSRLRDPMRENGIHPRPPNTIPTVEVGIVFVSINGFEAADYNAPKLFL